MHTVIEAFISFILSPAIWPQIIGAAGYAAVVFSGLFTNRIHLLTGEIVGLFLVSVQWFVLGSPSLAIAQLIFAYAAITGAFADRSVAAQFLSSLSLPFMAIFVFAFGEASLLYSMFVVVASAFGLLAKQQVKMVRLRGMCLSGTTCWFFLNLSAGSLPGMLCNVGYFIVHARGMIRLFDFSLPQLFSELNSVRQR